MNSLLQFNTYFQKNVLNHLKEFIKVNNSFFFTGLQNYFYYTFYKHRLLSSAYVDKIFSFTKQCSPQVPVLIRQEYVRYTYFPVCWENVFHLTNIVRKLRLSHIYEIAAGNGWVSYFLIKTGVSIQKAIDDFSWDKLTETEKPINVIKADAKLIIKNEQPPAVLTNWPPPTENFLYEIFSIMKRNSHLIVITDKDKNAAGNSLFFEHFKNKLIYEGKLPYSFPDFSDIIRIYQK